MDLPEETSGRENALKKLWMTGRLVGRRYGVLLLVECSILVKEGINIATVL